MEAIPVADQTLVLATPIPDPMEVGTLPMEVTSRAATGRSTQEPVETSSRKQQQAAAVEAAVWT